MKFCQLILLVIVSLYISACGGNSTPSSATTPTTASNEWTWVSGANSINQPGTYGGLGTAASSNVPGARVESVRWIDASGNFWILGGAGYDSAATQGYLNDLWKYSSGQWTWMGGSNLVNQTGTYGTQGTAAISNVPGARERAVGWTDASGNFWLFGGNGYDSAGNNNLLNDLWKYSSGEWLWMGGSSLVNQPGAYGIQGTAGINNGPGARSAAVSWTDAAGNFWLFSGHGLDSNGTLGDLSDLWEYNSGQWKWMSGPNIVNQPGTYGILATASPGNLPGARVHAASWIDSSGNFWLFGGNGYDSTGTLGDLNDLWEYSGGQWTWIGGSDLVNQTGTYGTQGMASATNVPGAREQALGWNDSSGDFWLSGGSGYDSTGTLGNLNDSWKYSSGQWTWISGANVVNQPGIYGVLGTPAQTNIPGARFGGVGWTDGSGNFWFFGGNALDSTGTPGDLNDLWEYTP